MTQLPLRDEPPTLQGNLRLKFSCVTAVMGWWGRAACGLARESETGHALVHDEVGTRMSYDEFDGDEDDGNRENTYLTFQVDGEEYAVPVAYVTEIVRLQKSFAVPDVPAYVRGVINLRGKVIPLLDVRHRFGLRNAEYDDRTVVVVMEVREALTGLVVDAVSEVAEIDPEQIETRSGLATGTGARPLVRGMAKRAAGVSFIVDVDALLTAGVQVSSDPSNAAQVRS